MRIMNQPCFQRRLSDNNLSLHLVKISVKKHWQQGWIRDVDYLIFSKFYCVGVGFAMIAVAFLCTIYYNVVIAWVIYYMYASIGSVVPWKYCGNKWNTENCYDGRTKSITKVFVTF